MSQTWFSVIPPLIVLVCATVFRQVSIALIAGILSTAFIASRFSIYATTSLAITRVTQEMFDSANILTALFLITLGVLISLMNQSGGTNAYGNILKRWLKDAQTVKFSSIGLSFCFMIDDFFSILTVGSVMRPISDSFKIPRAKLAYIIDSLSAPLVIIMPMSTWLAMLLMQIQKSGISVDQKVQTLISADQFLTYLNVIPFTFYSFACVLSVFFIVYSHISYGPMAHHEQIAERTGNLFGGKEPVKVIKTTEKPAHTPSIADFIIPVGSLILFCIGTILYSGNAKIMGGTNSVIMAIQQANIFVSLLTGGLAALLLSLVCMLVRDKVTAQELPEVLYNGLDLMFSSIITLLLAWTFSTMIRSDLQAGSYLATTLTGTIPGWSLPLIFYIVSFITATATGSSWGTIAVIMPIAIPMLPTFFNLSVPTTVEQIPLLYPIIGSIFSGAVAGDHVSPISPTTIMTATSAGAHITDHVSTQLPYAAPGLISCALGYLILGLAISQGYSLTQAFMLGFGIALGGTLLILSLLGFRRNK